jgi:hypothetical protein
MEYYHKYIFLFNNVDDVKKLTDVLKKTKLLFSLDIIENIYELTIDKYDFLQVTIIMISLEISPIEYKLTDPY